MAVVLAMGLAATASHALAKKRDDVVVLPLKSPRIAQTSLGILDELLAYNVADLGGFNVVTQQDIDAQMDRESLKDVLGCDDVTCAAEIGGALGARYLLAGSARKVGAKLMLTLSLIDTKSQQTYRGQALFEDDEDGYPSGVETAVRDALAKAANPGTTSAAEPKAGARPTSERKAPRRNLLLPVRRTSPLYGLEPLTEMSITDDKKDAPPCDAAKPVECRHLCEEGNARSCTKLGRAFEKGKGVSVSVTSAMDAYETGCNLGDTAACNFYGVLLGRMGKHKPALRNFERACDAGSAQGCLNVAFMHKNGRGVAKSIEKAAEIYRIQCAAKEEKGCKALLEIVASLPDLSFVAYETACGANYANACEELARKYEAGRGVKKNIDKARAVFWKACDAGENPNACLRLGQKYLHGAASGWPKDSSEANRALRRGCERELRAACNTLCFGPDKEDPDRKWACEQIGVDGG